jgi:hypothetical protein
VEALLLRTAELEAGDEEDAEEAMELLDGTTSEFPGVEMG